MQEGRHRTRVLSRSKKREDMQEGEKQRGTEEGIKEKRMRVGE